MKLHREDDVTKQWAKQLLYDHLWHTYKIPNVWSVPGVRGIGIDDRGLVVTTDNAADYVGMFIPAVLEGVEISVENWGATDRVSIPPQVDEMGGFYDMKRRGDGKTVQSGVIISGRESGSCFSVLQDNQGKHYAVCSSHVLDNSQNVRVFSNTVGHVTQDARHCKGSSHIDAAAALLNNNVPVSGEMIGLNVTPTGFAKPQVGMQIHTSGSNSGTTTQKITTINYDLQNDTGGNCSTHFQDCWIGSVRSKPGDSGSGMVNDQHQLVGILTTNVSKGSMNCSCWYMQQEMGLNVLSQGRNTGR